MGFCYMYGKVLTRCEKCKLSQKWLKNSKCINVVMEVVIIYWWGVCWKLKIARTQILPPPLVRVIVHYIFVPPSEAVHSNTAPSICFH